MHHSTITYSLFENEVDKVTPEKFVKSVTEKPYKVEYVWRNIILMSVIHLLALAGLLCIAHVKIQTIFFLHILLIIGTVGVQAGAHRLWSHRSYKANFGVRLFLAFGFTLSLQNDIYEWCRDHRAHHKFSDTDGDPHNSTRGFFFSHVGWLLCRKHPEVKRRGRTIDLSDLKTDPIVRFQKRHYLPLILLIWGFLPTFIPAFFWGENVWYALLTCVFMRYAYSLNLTWLVNSWTHLYGLRPYNAKIAPVESTCRHLIWGEGFHNYHHSFPWDYSASELGAIDIFNPVTAFIDFFHYMGWAWDLKKVNRSLVDSKKRSSGNPADFRKKNSPLYEWSTGIVIGNIDLFVLLAIYYCGPLF